MVPACIPFLNSSLCSVIYIPCDTTIHKILPVCENDCAKVTQGVSACIEFLIANDLDFINFLRSSTVTDFNCSNADTYLPDVSGSLFSSEFCRQFVYSTNVSTPEGEYVYNG